MRMISKDEYRRLRRENEARLKISLPLIRSLVEGRGINEQFLEEGRKVTKAREELIRRLTAAGLELVEAPQLFESSWIWWVTLKNPAASESPRG